MRKAVFLILAVLALGVLSISAFAQGARTGVAFIRIAHLAANVGAVDVYVNGALRSFGENIEGGEITGWLQLAEGPVELAVVPHGRSLSTAIIGPVSVDLARDTYTTIAAIGNAFTGGIDAQLIPQDFRDLPSVTAEVTVFHAIKDAPVVDLLAGGELLLGRLAYPGTLQLIGGGTNDGVSDVRVPGGTYNLAVVPNGQTEPVVIDLSGTTLEGGQYYFVAAWGTLDNPQVAVAVSGKPGAAE